MKYDLALYFTLIVSSDAVLEQTARYLLQDMGTVSFQYQQGRSYKPSDGGDVTPMESEE